MTHPFKRPLTGLLFAATLTASGAAQAQDVQQAVIDFIQCYSEPDAAETIADMATGGILNLSATRYEDSSSCIPFNRGGLTINGVTFDTICAFDEDVSVPDWSRYFQRGPGTSPGTFLELRTQASVGLLQAWALELSPSGYGVQIDSLYGGGAYVLCSSLYQQSEEYYEEEQGYGEYMDAVVVDPDGYTNIRSGPGTNYPIVGRVYVDELDMQAIPTNQDWWEVRTYGGTEGWMHASRIELIYLDQN
ncbi:SH3 domain-containing protein [Psychromarinibacter sp. S121]|uniref:SH3 domain-containing protein n=1 Tax=Psychromarinibacter sp. S121 TaxID=3415127 RepID=UPI003C7B6C6F